MIKIAYTNVGVR